jgi:outer membrane protein assembly factor BamB
LTLFPLLLFLGGFVSSAAGEAENWPCWRGPRGDGTSREKDIPRRWDGAKGEQIAWKVEVPGRGHASPIVWGDRIFLVSALEDRQQRILLALDRANGRTLWQRVVLESPLERINSLNSYASSTPATDGQLVYVSFLDRGEMFIAAYDFAGQPRWAVRPGPFASQHGYCSSPILYKDLVIVNGDHDGDAYLAALDRYTGRTVWKTPRENQTRSYSVPIIRRIDGRMQMILSGSKCVASYDPDNGSRHWILDGPTEQFVASPVYNGELLFITAGFPEFHILAIRPDGHGNVTKTHVAWRTDRGCAYVPSPILSDDGRFFLVVSDKGIASCFEARTGKRHWMERIGAHYSASAVSAGGLVYFLSDDGISTVVRPGIGLEVVARNPLGENCRASPAISGGRIYFRSDKNLFAVGP